MVLIGFSTNKKNWLSRLIRWGTGSPASHTFFVTKWNDVPVIVEAHWNGLRVVPFEGWCKDPRQTLVALFEPKKDITKEFTAALAYLGEPYDVGGLIGMAWVIIGRWLKRKWANPLDNHNALFCSEAVAMVLTWSSYPGWRPEDADGVAPSDLYEFFQNEDESKKVAKEVLETT